MSIEKVYDLDKDVSESFRFTLKGHEYIFKQMTTEEIDEFQQKKGDKEIREYLYTFITPAKDGSPKFDEMAKQMTAPHWTNFLHMVQVEMTGNESN